jgi:carbonic anhydrase
VLDDVERIRTHPLIPKSIPIYGFIYDVQSGKLIEVEGSGHRQSGLKKFLWG